VQGVPTLMLFDSDGKVRKRLVGFIGSDELLKSMKDVS
jgi:thioredoxin-related protein